MQVKVEELASYAAVDEQSMANGGPSSASEDLVGGLGVAPSAEDLSVSTHVVCKSCSFTSGEGTEVNICGFVALGCIQSLFALDKDVQCLPPDLQEDHITLSVSKEGFFEDLISTIDELQPGGCRQSISELLSGPLFSNAFGVSSKDSVIDDPLAEVQMMSAFSSLPVYDAAAVIFTAIDRSSPSPREHCAAVFRFQSPLIHRFAVIDTLDASGQVRVHFLHSDASVCIRVASAFQRQTLVADKVYTLTPGPSTISNLAETTAKRDPPLLINDDREFQFIAESGLSSHPRDDHKSRTETNNEFNAASSCPQPPLPHLPSDMHTHTSLNLDEAALSHSPQPPQPSLGTHESHTTQQTVASNSGSPASQELDPASSGSASSSRRPRTSNEDRKRSYSSLNSFRASAEPSGSLRQETSHQFLVNGDDDDRTMPGNFEPPPPYEELSPDSLLETEIDHPLSPSRLAESEDSRVESRRPASLSQGKALPQQEDGTLNPRSPSNDASASSPTKAAHSRTRARKSTAGDLSWMMSLQNTSVLASKPTPKAPTVPNLPKESHARPLTLPAHSTKATPTKSFPVFHDHGQLDLLFPTGPNRPRRRESTLSDASSTHPDTVPSWPSESTRPQSGRFLDISTVQDADNDLATGSPLSLEEPMSENAKLKQKASSNSLARHSHGEFQWQLDLQTHTPSTSRLSKPLPRIDHGDKWSPLLLRPELLQAESSLMGRAEGSSKPKPKKPRTHAPAPKRESGQSYNKSRNDIAWQLALVSKVLAPSDDYLKEREERFIKLNPRYKPEKFECLICFEIIQGVDGARVMNCEHSFCRDCLTGHVRSQLGENQYPIICPVCFPDPDRTTRGFVDTVVLEDLDLSAKELAKFAELELSAVIVKIDCPGCKGDLIVDREDYLAAPFITCNLPGCSSRFCRACLMVMEGQDDRHTCKIDEELDALMKANGWRYCPGCRTPIQKDSGCNHMTCKTPGCTTHFCYVCGDSIWNAQSTSSLSTLLTTHYRSCNQFDVDPPAPPVRIDAQGRPRRDCAIQ